jgi:hypothetical protein
MRCAATKEVESLRSEKHMLEMTTIHHNCNTVIGGTEKTPEIVQARATATDKQTYSKAALPLRERYMADDDCRMTALKCLLSCRTWPFNCGARVCASNGSFELVGSVTAAMAACTADCVSTAICSGDLRLPESGPKPPGTARPSGEAPALNDPLGPEKLSYTPAPPRLGELSF